MAAGFPPRCRRRRFQPLCLFVAGALAIAVRGSGIHHHPHHVHFERWLADVGKVYEDEQEKAERFGHWLRSFELVERHKEEAKQMNLPYKLGLNEYSDRTPEEWKQQRMGHKFVSPSQSVFDWEYWDSVIGRHKTPSTPPPTTVDWRTAEGNYLAMEAVSPIKNQRSCGGCWAFATAAGVEGTVAVEQGWLNEVSPQQLIDCDTPPNDGCMGGDIQYAFRYAMKNNLVTAADYTFTNGQKVCKANEFPPASKIQGYHMVPSCDEYALMTAVAQRPVVIAIAGYCDLFQSYAGGILTQGCSKPEEECSKQLDHAVTIVGYDIDQDTGIPYWIIKNSWGITWGDMGYAYIQRSVPGQKCGLGCLGYYPFYGVGGVAYVNGTVYADEDFVDEEAQQEKIRLALTYAIYILGGTATGLLVVIAGQMVVGMVRRRRTEVPVALREPLLNDEIVEG